MRTKIVSQGENRNDVFIPRHRFNDYYLNSNFKPNEIIAFITEVTDTNKRTKEQYDKEKNDFLKNNFPDENADRNDIAIFSIIFEPVPGAGFVVFIPFIILKRRIQLFCL